MLQDNLKILHIGDLHLAREFNKDSLLGASVEERKEELWQSLIKSFEFAKEEGVDLILIAGDIYENETMTMANIERFSHLLGQLDPIQVYMVLGNHDHISEKSDYLKSILPHNAFIFDNKYEYLEHKGARIYGFSWDREDYREIPFEFEDLDGEYINILLLHANISNENNYMPLTSSFLDDLGFDYLAMGHIHKPMKIGSNIYYCGSLEPLSFGDLGPRGGNLVSFYGKNKTVKFLDFSSRSYHKLELDISGLENNLSAFEYLELNLPGVRKKDFVKIDLIGRRNLNISIHELESFLRLRFEYLSLEDLTEDDIDLAGFILENKDNLAGKYFKYIYDNYQGREMEELLKIGISAFVTGDGN